MNKILKIIMIMGLIALIGEGISLFVKLKTSDSKNEISASAEYEQGEGREKVYIQYDEEKVEHVIYIAEQLAASKDYEGALSKLQTGQKVFPRSKELEEKAEEYRAIITADAAEAAKALAENGDYLGAEAVIRDTMEAAGNNDELNEKQQEYEESYVSDVMIQVEELVAEEDYAGADQVLASALENYPENTVLKDKQSEVRQYRLLYLLDVCPSYVVETDPPQNSFFSMCAEVSGGETFIMNGEEYTNGFTFSEYRDCDKRLYFELDGKYASLEFDAGCVEGYSEDERELNIYSDDTLIFTMTLEVGEVEHVIVDLEEAGKICIEIPEKTSGHYGTGLFSRPAFGLGNMQVCPR